MADMTTATGIEFSAELHDVIKEDLVKLYPELAHHYKITVYDVAPAVLSMFDEKLTKYATETFRREKIEIKTSHHVQELRKGAPGYMKEKGEVKEEESCYTLKLKEEGEVPIGECRIPGRTRAIVLTTCFRNVCLEYWTADESIRPKGSLG